MKHPNATVSGLSSAVGVLVIAALGAADVDLSPVTAAAVVAVASTAVLAIGRSGVRGIMARVWRGQA